MEKRCRYFNGLINRHCNADVSYQDVADPIAIPLRIPCLNEGGHCEKVSFLTEEEMQRKQTYFDQLTPGRYPSCHTEIERREQGGRI